MQSVSTSALLVAGLYKWHHALTQSCTCYAAYCVHACPILPNARVCAKASWKFDAGTLPPVVRELTMLSVLDLSGNTLTGTLPAVYASMPNLALLDLSQNQLTGKSSCMLYIKKTARLCCYGVAYP